LCLVTELSQTYQQDLWVTKKFNVDIITPPGAQSNRRPHCRHRRENLFYCQGVKKKPHSRGFFMPVIFVRLCCAYRYGVVIWAAFGLAAPWRGILTPLNHVAHVVRNKAADYKTAKE